MQGFMLGVKGIQCQQSASKFGVVKQLAHGNDFALVLLQGDGGMDALAGLADGAGHSQAATAPQMFAVNGDERIGIRGQLLVLPLEQQGFESLWVHRRQRPLKSAFRRHIVITGIVRIAAAAQGAALRIGELAGELGNLSLAHLHPAKLGQNDEGQDGAPPMPASLGAAGSGMSLGSLSTNDTKRRGGSCQRWR